MKKYIITALMALSTIAFAQEKTYKLKQIPTSDGGNWGAISFNGQVIFVDNKANVSKNDVFDSKLFILDKNNTDLKLPALEKYDKIGSPFISKDGKEFYFTVSGTVASKSKRSLFKSGTYIYTLQILISVKDANGEWAEPVPFQHNGNNFSTGDPCLSPDGKYLYFVSNREGGKGGTDIYRSKRNSDGSWGEPQNLSEINTTGDERFPRFDTKGNFYFSSTTENAGGLDLFVCTYNGNSFGKPVRMDYPFNSEGDDFAISFIGEDTGYLSSNRSGIDHIYFFEPLKMQIICDTVKVVETAAKQEPEPKVRPDIIFEEMLKSGKIKYVYFDFNKYDIRDSEIPALVDIIIFMRQYPAAVLELPSYSDCRGNDSYNMKLSLKRGEAVKNYLVTFGKIDANRITVKEYGATNPANDCNCSKSGCNDTKFEENRRVEYKVLKY
ncbi:MAG: OmpA family protein [Prevotellaceae bacterium]|jgi:outer membrane protein OmpA-like peptidoglycan-associated protein/Tol biopolymer transport system component|nr:OmpA family protein [Prevotellaceae bacterium]